MVDIQYREDGSRIEIYSNGRLIEYRKDGTSIDKQPDGVIIEKRPHGTVLIYDENNVTMLTVDGHEIKRNPNGDISSGFAISNKTGCFA